VSMKPCAARAPLGRAARYVGAAILLLQVSACRGPHELALFEGKPPKTASCAECATDSECGAAKPACAAGRCVACSADEHCPMDQVCNRVAAQCTRQCAQSEECSDKQAKLCDVNAAYCVECVADTDCTKVDRPRCETQAGSCVFCIEDSDCTGVMAHCSTNHTCVECVEDSQCPDAGACDLERAKCTAPKP
jgi:hypothetical protein